MSVLIGAQRIQDKHGEDYRLSIHPASLAGKRDLRHLPGCAGTLLWAALSEVDWYELAEEWLRKASEVPA